MSIALGDPRKMPPVRKGEITTTEREHIRRSENAAQAFPGRQARGLGLDLTKPLKTVKTDGFGSTMALYDNGTVSELSRRDAEHDRFAKLPKPIQRMAQEKGVTDLTLLEIAGAIHAKSEVYGGNRVQVFASDLAKATGTTTQRAEQLIDEAVRRGLIERTAQSIGGGTFRSRL
jgi:hypothetical protein